MLKTVERWQGLLWLCCLPLLFELLRLHPAPRWLWLLTLGLLFPSYALSIVILWRSLDRNYGTFYWFWRHGIEICLFIITPPLLFRDIRFAGLLMIGQAIVFVQSLFRDRDFRLLWARLLQRPALLLVLSFGLLICLGTLLLMLPSASTKTPHTFVEALFTATSATCVTGLVIKDTGTDFTLFGQCVILFLIQIGGLGIITFSSFLLWFMGRRLGIRTRGALSAILDETHTNRTLSLLRFIVIATVASELLGALLLFVAWHVPDHSIASTAYRALFHSISAFCNAGFALNSQSLVPYQSNLLVNGTMITLILLGGMGFPVLASVFDPEAIRQMKRRLRQQGWRRGLRLTIRAFPLNTKIVFCMQFALVFGIAALFFLLEFGHSLSHLGWFDKLQASLFQSVTLRTAGFNTVDFSLLTPATLLLMMFAMFVGGASGGTSGGIKLNTIAILGLMLRGILQGRQDLQIFGRSITRDNITRATAIITIFTALFFVFSGILLVTQPQIHFRFILFEVTSAMGTVGLTTANAAGTATTSLLDNLGRLCIIMLMFLGRLGPLTVAFAIAQSPQPGRYVYPQERIYVG